MPSPRSTTKRTHAERSKATQQHLIQKAIEVIQDKSFEAATIYEVAKAAGLTPGAVQHHFESKAALMMQVLSQLIAADDREGALWPAPGLPLEERASHFVSSAWQLIYAEPRFVAAWNMYLGSRNDAEVMVHIAKQRGQLMDRMTEGFCTAFPELANASDRTRFIAMVFSTLRGLGLLQIFEDSRAGADAQLSSLADTIARRCQDEQEQKGSIHDKFTN